MRVIEGGSTPTPAELVAEHVAVPDTRPSDRAFVRLNMIASADGGSAVDGLSSGLGNRDDHLVFAALRGHAEAVLVGMGTAVAERYHAPGPGLHLYVVASRPDISAIPELFESENVTLVLPEGAGAAPDGVSVVRVGAGKAVDLRGLLDTLAGTVVLAEGGPTLAGRLSALGLVDEFFLSISPRLISGDSSRVAHGPEASSDVWHLHHAFVDDESFLFLRYARS